MKTKKIPIVGNGKNRYQFIYAKDLAKAFELALNANYSDVFNIGSDDVKSFNEIYSYIIKKNSVKIKINSFSQRTNDYGYENMFNAWNFTSWTIPI